MADGTGTQAASLDELTVPAPPAGQNDWNEDGVVKLKGFYADERGASLVREYSTVWWRTHCPHGTPFDSEKAARGGWPHATPYVDEPTIRALVAPLAPELHRLLGEPAGMHLNLTGWVSTERDWHQDSYLNPPHVGDKYAAVWIALDDINPMSGPFQYVPGSHRWRQVTREKIGTVVDLADPAWPRHSEAVLSPLFEDEITQMGGRVRTYLPYMGDVLIWHGRLLHRGSRALMPQLIRPALIVHFSGIHHREDMPSAVLDEFGGWIFPLGGRQPVR